MPNNLILGKQGEEEALKFLKEKGYNILETNWRHRHLEADIIAFDNKTLVIVEVKTRSTRYFGEPEEFVNRDKQKKLIATANEYVLQKNIDAEVRFDIVSIVTAKSQAEIYHIEDAFYPSLKRG